MSPSEIDHGRRVIHPTIEAACRVVQRSPGRGTPSELVGE